MFTANNHAVLISMSTLFLHLVSDNGQNEAKAYTLKILATAKREKIIYQTALITTVISSAAISVWLKLKVYK